MARLLLVQPGAGAPEVLPLEAWQALTSVPVFAAPGDSLATRLRDAGYEVTDLAEAAPAPAGSPMRGRNLLQTHEHGAIPEHLRGLAARLVSLAHERGEVAYILDTDDLVRAVMEQALGGGLEVEFVIGMQPRGHTMLSLVRVMARLRGPGGCPWDAEQTHQTLAKHLVDETYELLDAIETGSAADIAEELGDLLLQVVFHAQMGLDAGTFDIDDVATGIATKLVRRHPHVFGDVEVSGAAEVVANWDVIKEHEKQRASVLDGVPESLPALAYAQKLQRRAGDAGFDWRSVDGALAKVREEAEELAQASNDDEREAEFGDLMFSLVALGRHLDIDAEGALRRAARTFRDRLAGVEEQARVQGVSLRDLPDEELEALWQRTKRP